MESLFQNLAHGLSVAVSLQNLGLCFIGAVVGTLIGVLPGVGPIATIAMLLPLTFNFDPTGALIMLAGIYYGAQYGGSTTAVLINVPGEATSVVTTLDGHQMARQGRAGVALGTAAIVSFVAGTVSTVIVAALGVPLTRVALLFGPAEYFALMLLGLAFAVVLARGSLLKAAAVQLKAQADPATRKRLEDLGGVIPEPQQRTPEYLVRFVTSEMDRWSKALKAPK